MFSDFIFLIFLVILVIINICGIIALFYFKELFGSENKNAGEKSIIKNIKKLDIYKKSRSFQKVKVKKNTKKNKVKSIRKIKK
jgi:hypothetical protein